MDKLEDNDLNILKPHELNDDAYIVVYSNSQPKCAYVKIKDMLLYLEAIKNSTI